MACITLTTDFGTQDGYVGAMKGRILSIASEATILDLTHDLPPQDLIQAAYCLLRSIPQFPKETIHVVVVDPGVGSERNGLVAQTQHGILVAPDNGILSLLLDKFPPRHLIRINKKTPLWQTHTSFDGLEVFAPVGAHLAEGMSFEEVGESVEAYCKLSIPQPFVCQNQIMGEIVLFDRFGNAITNISAELLAEKSFSVFFQEKKIQFHRHYQQGSAGDHQPLALINSDQLLEVAIFCGSIQKEYGLKKGDKVQVLFK